MIEYGSFVCKLYIKYHNPNISQIFEVIKEINQHTDTNKLQLVINTNEQNDLLNQIIKLDCFSHIELGKKYNSMFKFNPMNNLYSLTHTNHFYSNIELLPDNLKILQINIKQTSDIFINLPYNLEYLKCGKLQNGRFEANVKICVKDIKSILIVNTDLPISESKLFNAECLVINKYNKHIDWTNLSNKIKIIYFRDSNNFLTNSELDYLPDSVHEINLYCKYDPNAFANIPISVRNINFYSCSINFPYLKRTNVECINLYACNLMRIKNEYIPQKIKKITIFCAGNYYSDIINYYTNIFDNYKKTSLVDFNYEFIERCK